ncbi:hypothetical protein GCM10027258_82870 [Amycolatopsis stemonae]
MAKQSRLAERLRALKDLSGLSNVEIAKRSKNFVVTGTQRRHPLNDRSIGDWLRGDHIPPDDGLHVLVGVMLAAAVNRRPPISPSDPELMKGVGEGSWLAWREEVQERDGRHPVGDSSPWEELVRETKIWPDADDATELRGQALAALRQLDGERRRAVETALIDDPWLDEELPERTVRRVGELMGYLSGAGNPILFSAAEAFLLTVAPLLHHTRWAQNAAKAHPHVDPNRLQRHPGREAEPEYEFFLSGGQQQRLVERAGRIPAEHEPDRRAICWWLFHRWLDQSATGQAPAGGQQLPGLESPQAAALEHHLTELLQVFRLSPGKLKDWRLSADHSEEWLGGHQLRIRLVAFVLGLAHTMAIEPGSLSSTLVEHLGIDHQVDLADVRRTLRGSRWVRTPTALRLNTECRHEAVYEVLTEHVTRMSEVLRAAREAAARETAVAPLLALPERASDEDVRPAEREGQPEFVVPTTKFRLDETRVRELLMGEQLYRDRSLAIRELYQNALDACRYSQAWRRYIVVKNGGPRDWSWPGKIEFRQWEEDGRHFLSCRDNGVGMGEAELREVFSQAGIRFADRREFAVERARWEEENIHVYPNSRFGIGVMSYFMLADRIEVTTRRMNPGGERLPLVKVVIAGPGHLFRVETLTGPDDDGRDAGTEVKLHLRDGAHAPSCVVTLRRLLGIAEFETMAKYGDEEVERWHPFEFIPRRRHPARDDSIEAYGRLQHGVASDNGQVVWCESGGALLVDGIYVRCENQRGVLTAQGSHGDPRGAVINLTGRYSPRLSVDRMSVLQDVSEQAEVLLNEATAELRRPDSLLGYKWTLDIAKNNPGIADIVADAAIVQGMPTRVGPYDTTADVAGVIELDPELAHDDMVDDGSWSFGFAGTAPQHVLLWRLLALNAERADDTGRPLRPALPSDNSLINLVRFTQPDSAHRVEAFPPSVWRAAFRLGISPTKAIRRLAHLGYSVAECETLPPPAHIDSTDVVLIETSIDFKESSEHHTRTDLHAQLVIASARLDLSMAQVAQRLSELGLERPRVVPPGRADGTDVRLISNYRDLPFDTDRPCLASGEPVSALYLLLAARATGLEPAHAVNRLRRLGWDVPDFEVTMADLDALAPALRKAMEEVNEYWQKPRASEICREAMKAGCQPGELVRELARFGIHTDKQLPEQLTATDQAFMPFVRDLPDRIEPRALLGTLLRVSLTAQETANRLEAMGFNICETVYLLPDPDSIDREILQGIDLANHSGTVDLRSFAMMVTRTDYPSEEVAKRLAKFGFSVEYPKDFDDVDAHLIPPNLPAMVASGQREVPLSAIFQHADDYKMEPRAIISCLRELGCSAPEPTELTEQDFALLCEDKSSLDEALDVWTPLTMSKLLESAIRAAMPIHEAAARLTKFGYHFKFTNLEDELQRLHRLVAYQRDGSEARG